MQKLQVTTFPSVFIIDPRERNDLSTPATNLRLRIDRYGGHMTADDIFQCAKDVIDCRSVSVTTELIQELFPNMARLVQQQEEGNPQKTRSSSSLMEGRTHTMKASRKKSKAKASVERAKQTKKKSSTTKKRSTSRKRFTNRVRR